MKRKSVVRLLTKFVGRIMPVLAMLISLTACDEVQQKPVDESFITIFEGNAHGEPEYWSQTLYIFPDNTAFLRSTDYIVYCRVEEQVGKEATLSVIRAYKKDGDQQVADIPLPGSLSAAWGGTDGTYVNSADRNFKNFKNPVFRYNKRRMGYSPVFVLHDRLVAQEAMAVEEVTEPVETPEAVEIPDEEGDGHVYKEPATTVTIGASDSKASDKVSATGVPIKPDRTGGSIGGTLNDFTPKNIPQFLDYYFGIIVFVFFLLELGVGWYGSKFDDFTEQYRHHFDTYTTICFVLLLIESVFEIVVFTANPLVMFQSDWPLFGCLGRVLFFCSMCIGQAVRIRIMRAKLHWIYRVSVMKYSWALTVPAVALTFFGIYTLYNIYNGHAAIGAMNGADVVTMCICGVWGLSVVRLIRIIVKTRRAPLPVILFYTLIYPLFIPVAILGLAIGVLAKIAIEKPESETTKIAGDENSRYITDALGNTVYVTKISDGYWQDTHGAGYSERGGTFSNLNTGTPYW